jgi:ribosomal protein S18 acetylase RimI-like enzyme
MRMTIALRLATREDAPNLAALSIQVWLHTYATTGLRTALSEYVLAEFTAARFRALLDDANLLVVVAEMDAHLVGYAKLDFEAPCADLPELSVELATLYVQEHFAGRGIGSSLLSACRAHALRRTGAPDLWLSVYHLNRRAVAFYEKHGMTVRGSFFFEFGGERHKNWIMR